MCGRYTTRKLQVLFEEFTELKVPFMPPVRFNIAPTQDVPVIRRPSDAVGCELGLLRWGLIPHWADDPSIGVRMINARSETVATKPAFRDAFRQRRCLLPADGFYEWRTAGRAKHPYFVHFKDDAPFCFAGLWESWDGPQGPVESCTILTTSPNEVMRPIHNRMPVVLSRPDYGRWLDPEASATALAGLMEPCPAGLLEAYPVSRYVNRAANDGPECVAPAKPEEEQPPGLW
jgi:putative SOS response-associated peptidase YedK